MNEKFRHEKELMGEGRRGGREREREKERRAHAISSPDEKSTCPCHGKRGPAIPLSILDNEAFLQTQKREAKTPTLCIGTVERGRKRESGGGGEGGKGLYN